MEDFNLDSVIQDSQENKYVSSDGKHFAIKDGKVHVQYQMYFGDSTEPDDIDVTIDVLENVYVCEAFVCHDQVIHSQLGQEHAYLCKNILLETYTDEVACKRHCLVKYLESIQEAIKKQGGYKSGMAVETLCGLRVLEDKVVKKAKPIGRAKYRW